ncbi:hypothetical protein BJB45_07480 [Halomonas huangheensis]|uniref:Uncharacterized protein n=1 Tax=Halomonas huangheensis TaxID=1178482 RepID=W1N2X7_9GAMM|nr:hypothetical protein BJB45_07480 [Halomonas huangheensis]
MTWTAEGISESVLEGKQTDKELRYLSGSDVLFEVLPV